ncbi:hypothetical protein ACVC7V_24780 [Hydrogenophaga sp. A37]|uniref:hypothetical protein n=1 Tax=Hydrogenophaga sp. A37 TaxID=1945864 RepID=UPI001179DC2A|nr:hypothetical protein [Hydrogenophaga sp. A37]
MEAEPNPAPELLLTEEAWGIPSDLYSCVQAKGMYSPLRFVLRLRPDIHRALNSAPEGVVTGLTTEQIFAFSTYLHETIHWWQHVGTTSGLMLSLLYPAQAHIAHPDLIATLPEIGPVKPLRIINMSAELQGNITPETKARLNKILNNWHDIEFCRRLIIEPKSAPSVIDDPYFESVGHSYWIALANVLSLLISTIDPEHHLVADPRNWQDAARRLHARETALGPEGKKLQFPAVGAKQIFEGQARVSQIQYLHHAGGQRHNWSDFKDLGMLEGVYVEAFDTFLRATTLSEPADPKSPTVGLFLLVCDLALNPAEGLLVNPVDFESIVEIVDPGWRFIALCTEIRRNPSKYSSRICGYTREEYVELSDELSSARDFMPPSEIARHIREACGRSTELSKLVQEDRTFEFGLPNLPVRVFSGRFLAFQLQKSETPHFFCWPGICMTPNGPDDLPPERALDLFEEHRALFLDKEDGDVYPRTFKNRSEVTVHNVFNTFYAWVSTYELTRQWIVSPGDFEYGFSWLSSQYPVSEREAWASTKFREVYGVAIEDFTVLASVEI